MALTVLCRSVAVYVLALSLLCHSFVVTTSPAILPVPLYGAVAAYSSQSQNLSILGGNYEAANGNDLLENKFVLVYNLLDSAVLYNSSSAAGYSYKKLAPNVVPDAASAASAQPMNIGFGCSTNQCAAQIGSRLYVVNPLVQNAQRELSDASRLMLVYDADDVAYVPQHEYALNIPDVELWSREDTGCVATDGATLFVLGNRLSSTSECPDGSGDSVVCPLLDLYSYSPALDAWTQRGELAQPQRFWRFQVGCAALEGSGALFLFGGVSRLNPSAPSVASDASVRESRR